MQFLQFELCDFATGAAIPFGKCTVYLTGTATLAALFDSGGSAIANPAVAASNALVGFAAADGVYDFQLANADGSLNGPKIVKQQIFDLTALSANETIYLKNHGIVADAVLTGGVWSGTLNSAAAIEALIAAVPNSRGCKIELPMGSFRLDRTPQILRPIIIEGYGGGDLGGGDGRSGSAIVVPAGATGLRIQHTPSNGGQGSDLRDFRVEQEALLTTTGTASFNTASPTTITVSAGAANFANGQVVMLEGGGPSLVVQDRTVAMTSGSNVATVTNVVANIGNPGVYVNQPISIAGAGAAGAALVGFVGAWTTTTITVVDSAGANLNAGTTVTAAAYTITYPLVGEISAGGGTGTLTIASANINPQNVTNGTLRHAAPGIHITIGNVKCHNVQVINCRVGLYVHGNTAAGEVADNNSFYDCALNNDFAGVILEGADAQVNSFFNCNFAGPKVGVLDMSFLGNDFYGCHWAFNVGIAVAATGSVTKILGGYMEAGTSYIAPPTNDCSFWATTSMLPGSGWTGMYASSGALVTGRVQGTVGEFTGGAKLGGANAYMTIFSPGSVGPAFTLLAAHNVRAAYYGGFGHWWDANPNELWVLDGNPLALYFNGTEVARTATGGVNLASGKVLSIAGTQVVGPRDTGWVADTGTARKASNATYAAGTTLTYSATYVQAEQTAMATRVAAIEAALQNFSQTQKALKDAKIAAGSIGT